MFTSLLQTVYMGLYMREENKPFIEKAKKYVDLSENLLQKV